VDPEVENAPDRESGITLGKNARFVSVSHLSTRMNGRRETRARDSDDISQPHSRFYGRDIYRETRETLEKCLDSATKWIFAVVIDILTIEYPKELSRFDHVLQKEMEEESQRSREEIQDRLQHLTDARQEITNLLRCMNK
jgi:hypothetical protein